MVLLAIRICISACENKRKGQARCCINITKHAATYDTAGKEHEKNDGERSARSPMVVPNRSDPYQHPMSMRDMESKSKD